MRTAVAVLTAALVLAACSSGAERQDPPAQPTPAAQAPTAPVPTDGATTGTPTATAAPTPTPTPTPTPEPDLDALGLAEGEYPSADQVRDLGARATCGYLGEEWCTDSNGDGWPDLLAEAAGRDPSVDPCGTGGCSIDLQDFLAEIATNTLFLLDASGSMRGTAGGGVDKMTAAKEALVQYVLGTPDAVDLGLVVYGHRGDNTEAGRAESCAGIESFADIGELTAADVEATVAQFEATGWTPIGGALDAAGPLLLQAAEADRAAGVAEPTSRVIVISDGIETCGGDPVASAAALRELGIEVVVDVIGFDIEDADREALQQVALVGGGTYSEASTDSALREVLAAYRQQWTDALGASGCTLQATNEASSCRRQLATDITSVVRGEMAPEILAEDPDRARFLDAWFTQLSRERDAATTQATQAQYDEFQEVFAQVEEAIARLDQRTGGRSSKVVRPAAADPCAVLTTRRAHVAPPLA